MSSSTNLNPFTTCRICGQPCTNLGQHINKSHYMSIQEYYDDYIKSPSEGICPICSRPTPFSGRLKLGYRSSCGNKKCVDAVRALKGNQTKIERYGSTSYNNREKHRKTCLLRYGVNSFVETDRFKEQQKQQYNKIHGELAQQKKASTRQQNQSWFEQQHDCTARHRLIKQYGQGWLKGLKLNYLYYKNTAFVQNCDIPKIQEYHKYTHQQHIQQTKQKKYGNSTYTNPNKQVQTKKERYGTAGVHVWEGRFAKLDEFEQENQCTRITKLIDIYGQGWLSLNIPRIQRGQNTFISNRDIPRIQEYNSINHRSIRSKAEKEVLDFIKMHSPNTEVLENIRGRVPHFELDIYIPKLNLAIEYNGTYWHSLNHGISPTYHLEKTVACEQAGIRLIHIFEWEWTYKKSICQALLLSALPNELHNQVKRVYARNCEIRVISSQEAYTFYERYHLQGGVYGQYSIGLFYDKELVQCITLGKGRFDDSETELLRLCTKCNVRVIGGFSKLLSHQPWDSMISYVDRGKFTGNGYIQAGFSKIAETPPSYCYYKNETRLTRMQAQKHKLPMLLGKQFDQSKTETQNMMAAKYHKVYDSGNLKFVWCREVSHENTRCE